MSKVSIVEKIKRKSFNVFRATETKLHELKSILWECTLRCNLNCGHCGSDCLAVSTVADADEKLLW